ncbi:MAG: hypothetical protein C5B49_09590 [Bdellovibrio sp.]|nr:MAG: hypothetical protein C5B49_09590 [Bdellovibrio sp.]
MCGDVQGVDMKIVKSALIVLVSTSLGAEALSFKSNDPGVDIIAGTMGGVAAGHGVAAVMTARDLSTLATEEAQLLRQIGEYNAWAFVYAKRFSDQGITEEMALALKPTDPSMRQGWDSVMGKAQPMAEDSSQGVDVWSKTFVQETAPGATAEIARKLVVGPAEDAKASLALLRYQILRSSRAKSLYQIVAITAGGTTFLMLAANHQRELKEFGDGVRHLFSPPAPND